MKNVEIREKYGNWAYFCESCRVIHKNPSECHIVQEATSKRFREIYQGEGNPFYGKKHSLESRKKISDANTGKKSTPWKCSNCGKMHTSPMQCEVSRKRMAKTQKKRWKEGFYDDRERDYTVSEETKEKMRKAMLRWHREVGFSEATKKQISETVKEHYEEKDIYGWRAVSKEKQIKSLREYWNNASEKRKLEQIRPALEAVNSDSFMKTSRPQIELFNLIKEIFPDAKLNYRVIIEGKRVRFLDVAVLSQRIDFEFDSEYWHDEEKDKTRDLELANLGWKVIRINYDLLGRIKSIGVVKALNGIKVRMK